MPSVSKAQRQLMAIAEHHPSEVSKKNRGVLKMSKKQLHDFAKTKEKGLPNKVADKMRAAGGKHSMAGKNKKMAMKASSADCD